MSLSWLERRFGQSTIRLERQRITVARRKLAPLEIPLMEGTAETGEPSWVPVLEALARLLKGDGAAALPGRLRLVIANDFVRYALVPWSEPPLNENERELHARALFADRFGDRERQWRVVVEPARFQRAGLAAALDEELVARAETLVRESGRRLVAMVPALVESVNCHSRGVGRSTSGWVVDAGDERLACLAFAGRQWRQVGGERLGADPADTLQSLLNRDILRSPELAEGRLFLNHRDQRFAALEKNWTLVYAKGSGD